MELKHTEIKTILIEPTSGASLRSCICDALVLAMSKYVHVTLIHNNRRYQVNPEKFVGDVDATSTEISEGGGSNYDH